MKAKVVRVRCSKCRAQQEFFFRVLTAAEMTFGSDGDPTLMNAIDPTCSDPHFFLRSGSFHHVPTSKCDAGPTAVNFERRLDARICPVCLRPSPNEPDRRACKWQDCRATFVKVPIDSGTGSHKPRKIVVDLGSAQ